MDLVPVQATGDPRRFTLDVGPSVSVGHPDSQFLFGGAGLAAGIAAAEAATGRPTIWAAAHYLSYARPGSRLDLEVAVPASGRHIAQARVTARAAGAEILTVNLALGGRAGSLGAQWVTMPEVPPPGDCPPMTYDWERRDDDANGQFDQRPAQGRFGVARRDDDVPSSDGTARMWVRRRDGLPPDRRTLAMMADFLPSGLGNALGRRVMGNSLDNTIRFAQPAVDGEGWVLLDMRFHAARDGFAHARVHLFGMDGTLLATAGQSLIVRELPTLS